MIYLNIVGRGSNWFIKINGCKNGWNVLSLSIIKDEFFDIKLWWFLSMLVFIKKLKDMCLCFDGWHLTPSF
jgi:hypothetical protein